MDEKKKICIVDFEASSLSQGSYPIQIGWGFPETGEVFSHLIKPANDWTLEFWDEKSASIHNISYKTLLDYGESCETVLNDFMSSIKNAFCYSDAPPFDQYWLYKLMEGAGQPVQEIPFYKIQDAVAIKYNDSKYYYRIKEQVQRIHPATHHADQDVKHMMEIWNRCKMPTFI